MLYTPYRITFVKRRDLQYYYLIFIRFHISQHPRMMPNTGTPLETTQTRSQVPFFGYSMYVYNRITQHTI